MLLRKIIKEIVPPFLLNMVRFAKGIIPFAPFYGVEGNFSTWEDALDYCNKKLHMDGYQATNIIDKVSTAIQEVRSGNAEFERDGVLFYEKDYNFQLLTALFLAFSGFDGTMPISVVDFGGSLGSTFFQNRSLFTTLHREIKWNVIEQRHFVDRGRKEVPEINFYYSLDDYLDQGGQCDILLCSAVLEYLSNPNAIMESLLKHPWRYILIDRSFYHPDDKEQIAVQTVPPSIYKAQYPLWLRSVSKQDSIMKGKDYIKILQWESPFTMPFLYGIRGRNVPLRGFLYKKMYRSKKENGI